MLTNSYYRIDIVGASFSDGFIDNVTPQNYAEFAHFSNYGTGYSVGDILTVTGGTFTTAGTITVTSITSTGAIATYTTTPGTYSVLPTYPAAVTDTGPGSGAAGFVPAGTFPTDLTHSLTKSRGNIRYRAVLDSLNMMANCYACNEFDSNNSPTFTWNAPPATLSFTVYFERDDYVQTPDELTAGATLFNVAAVKRCIARAMLASRTVLRDVYDPTLSNGLNNASAANYARNSTRLMTVVAPALVPSTGVLATDIATAAATITVTQITNVTLSIL